MAGVPARNSTQGVRSTQARHGRKIALATGDKGRQAADPSAQRSPSSASSTASMDGVLIVSPLKMPSISLPPLVRRNSLGSGQAGLWLSRRATARGRQHQHPVLRLAAQHLLPGPGHDIELGPGQMHGEGGRGGVAQGEALAPVRDPVAVGHPHTRGGAVPAEHHVAARIDLGEVGQLAVGRDQRAHVGELELLLDVDQPPVAEALESYHVDAARAQQAPHRASKAPVSEPARMPTR